MKNLKSSIIKMAIGIIIGVLFFYSCSKTAQKPTPVTKKEIAATVTNVEQAEEKTNLQNEKIADNIKDLNKHIAWLNLNLDASDNTIANLRKKQSASALKLPTTNDFTEENKQDFLVEVEALENAHDNISATCDSINFDLTKTVNLKDTIIKNKDSLYAILRSSFNKSIDDNYKMIDFSNKQRKQIRNNKIENYLLKVAIIAGGVYILKK
jgi:RNAse (barnase) inhibitor barstar